MKKITQEELNIILKEHKLWLKDRSGKRADLSDCDLSQLDMSYSDMSYSNMRGADMSYSDMSYSNMSYSNMRGADMSYSDMSYSDMNHANMRYANMCGSNMSYANMRYANMCGSNMSYANLGYSIMRGGDKRNIIYNGATSFFAIQCPEEGSFIGYKKCQDKIVTLQITEDAERSSATSRKCRCSKAKVISIEDGLTSIASDYDESFIYKVGEVAEVEFFDKDRWNECSTGIHFFITKQEAINY